MQRVTRDAHASQDSAQALDQTVALIRQHFPPTIAHLYAIPRQGKDGALEWWSELAGQPHLYATLNREQQAALLMRYEERQTAVGHLALELERRGQEQAAKALRGLIGAPDLDNLYSVNGEPLVVRWGQQPAPLQAPSVAHKPKPAPVTAPTKPAAPKPAPAPRTVSPPRRWLMWPWLLGLLLLAALWWMYAWWPSIHQWWVAPGRPTFACVPGTPSQAAEFSVVLDTSGSMDSRIRVKQESDPWYIDLLQKVPLLEDYLASKGPQRVTRMEVAKNSLGTLVENLDKDIDMRLVTFNGCRAPLDHGVFDRDKRPQLTELIQKLDAKGGTGLGISLEAAARQMNGRDRDGVIVMFVDGSDSCGQSVCKVSRQIAQAQPRLRINVVNISASTGSNCAAENTGGRVYTANDAAAVAAALQEASLEVSSGVRCE